jgi:hypothetical protein
MKNPLYILPILLASSASVTYSLSKSSGIPGGSMANMLFKMSSYVACALGLAVIMTLGGASAKAGALFSTGNGDTTCGDLDVNWTVQGTGLNGGVSEAATILNSSGCPGGGTANFYGSWAADTAASSWIGVQATNTGLPGVGGNAPPYTFTLAFTLSSIPSSITGTWYIDDEGSLFANGTQIGAEGDDTFTGAAFSIPSADLVTGSNTISVEMLYADGVDDGTRVEFNPISTSGVPEPGSLFLCSAGAAAILFRARQRLQRRKQ